MTYEEKRVILKKKGGCLRCPNCKRKLLEPLEDTTCSNFPLFCKTCKIKWIISINECP